MTYRPTGVAGDPKMGRDWFVGRKLGNCLARHENSDAGNEQFHGKVGPPLDGAAARYTDAKLGGIIVDSEMTFEETIVPASYKDIGFSRPCDTSAGNTILTAQQVEDIIAYLRTLKD